MLSAREIGIRVALGASRAGVFRMILSDGLRLTLIGGIVGLVAIIGLIRFLRSLHFEIQPLDPVTLISVICVLISVSLLASYVPAQRATKGRSGGSSSRRVTRETANLDEHIIAESLTDGCLASLLG